jgi:hypothetical protein
VAVSVDPSHGEALNNIAVLEMRRQKFDLARSCLSTSMDVAPQLFEPLYNTGRCSMVHVVCVSVSATGLLFTMDALTLHFINE